MTTLPIPPVPGRHRKAAARTLRDTFGLSLAAAHNLLDGQPPADLPDDVRHAIVTVLNGYITADDLVWLLAVATVLERGPGVSAKVEPPPSIAPTLTALTLYDFVGDGRHVVITGARLDGPAWLVEEGAGSQEELAPLPGLYSPDPAKAAARVMAVAATLQSRSAADVLADAIAADLADEPPRRLNGEALAVSVTVSGDRVAVTGQDASQMLAEATAPGAQASVVADEARRTVNEGELARDYDGWPQSWPDGRVWQPGVRTGWLEPAGGGEAVWIGDVDPRWRRVADEDTELSSCCFAQVTYSADDGGLHCKGCYHDVVWDTPDGLQHGQPPMMVELTMDDIQDTAVSHGTCEADGCDRPAVIVAPNTVWDDDADMWLPTDEVHYFCVEHAD